MCRLVSPSCGAMQLHSVCNPPVWPEDKLWEVSLGSPLGNHLLSHFVSQTGVAQADPGCSCLVLVLVLILWLCSAAGGD